MGASGVWQEKKRTVTSYAPEGKAILSAEKVYVQSAYVPDNAVIKYKVRLADGTEEARAICLLDCTQTPRDRNGDYLATVEDTSIVNAKLMIWDG